RPPQRPAPARGRVQGGSGLAPHAGHGPPGHRRRRRLRPEGDAMSWIPSSSGEAGLVRAAEAETLIAGSSRIQLLLDSSATGGALSAHRVRLADGAEGANPHRHTGSSGLFYVLGGGGDLLARGEVVAAAGGDVGRAAPGLGRA